MKFAKLNKNLLIIEEQCVMLMERIVVSCGTEIFSWVNFCDSDLILGVTKGTSKYNTRN